MFKLKDFKLYFSGRIAPSGIRFVIFALFCTFIINFFSSTLGIISFLVSIFILYFFRDPERIPPSIPNTVVSPADGLIVDIKEEYLPSYILNDNEDDHLLNKKYKKISVFLNIFDVHVNRFPIDGTVVKKYYRTGQFLSVLDTQASNVNEQLALIISNDKGYSFVCIQIAGLIARRIACDVDKHDKLSIGSRYGIIYFGSMVNIYIPVEYDVLVRKEQRMVGGETIIAINYNL